MPQRLPVELLLLAVAAVVPVEKIFYEEWNILATLTQGWHGDVEVVDLGTADVPASAADFPLQRLGVGQGIRRGEDMDGSKGSLRQQRQYRSVVLIPFTISALNGSRLPAKVSRMSISSKPPAP